MIQLYEVTYQFFDPIENETATQTDIVRQGHKMEFENACVVKYGDSFKVIATKKNTDGFLMNESLGSCFNVYVRNIFFSRQKCNEIEQEVIDINLENVSEYIDARQRRNPSFKSDFVYSIRDRLMDGHPLTEKQVHAFNNTLTNPQYGNYSKFCLTYVRPTDENKRYENNTIKEFCANYKYDKKNFNHVACFTMNDTIYRNAKLNVDDIEEFVEFCYKYKIRVGKLMTRDGDQLDLVAIDKTNLQKIYPLFS